MAPPLLTLQDIQLSFGGSALLERADLNILERDRVCLVGLNGSGKSTLLKIAAGLIEPDAGTRFVKPGNSVRYLEQEPDLTGHETVLDYVCAGLDAVDGAHRAQPLIGALGLGGDERCSNLSGGESRRAAIARVLAAAPDILMLDEATNHLDLAAIEWLEARLGKLNSAIVMISHDRRFLENLSNRTVWIDRGRTRALDSGFGAFEAWRDAELEREEIERHKVNRKIEREQHWLTYGVTARRKRNQRRLGALQALRVEARRLAGHSARAHDRVNMAAAEGQLSGKRVIEADGIAKAFDGKPVVDGFSVKIHRRDRIGIVGPNGAGKTTLVNLLTGALTPDAGVVRLGTGLKLASLDQRRASLDPDTNLQDILTGGTGDMVTVGEKQRHVVSYMKDFLFQPEQANTTVDSLSGGERGRLMLARALARPSNVLVLDEPTNDLDLETLDLLQEMLGDYSGTVLLVSHDRDFLDRTVTATIASDGDGFWTVYAGGYSDMLAQRPSLPEPDTGKSAGKTARVPSAKPGKSGGREQPAVKRKLSYKDTRALNALPGLIEELTGRAAQLEAKLVDPDFYGRDPLAFQETADALAAARAELEGLEEEWLKLELLRDEMEGA